jgi:hypothetical protein
MSVTLRLARTIQQDPVSETKSQSIYLKILTTFYGKIATLAIEEQAGTSGDHGMLLMCFDRDRGMLKGFCCFFCLGLFHFLFQVFPLCPSPFLSLPLSPLIFVFETLLYLVAQTGLGPPAQGFSVLGLHISTLCPPPNFLLSVA